MNKSKVAWVVFSLLVAGPISKAAATTELVFFTWPDYMNPEILIKFEQRTGIKLKQRHFDSDIGRDELLLEIEGKSFDEALVIGASIRILAKRGWLEALEKTVISNRIAEEFMPVAFKSDSVIYPSKKALEKTETYYRLPAHAQKIRAEIFSRLAY
ncbi:hypothetical protein [Halomonas sp. M20]|uniref:hypothetical protein n=1 Tax=Halomonas sp. M20 TaxID=2763264 RepID=UPI001D0A6836|nr:hypothetical protein [Halomonas sp. M20]